MGRVIRSVLGVMLLGGGVYVLYMQLFQSLQIKPLSLIGAGFLILLGASTVFENLGRIKFLDAIGNALFATLKLAWLVLFVFAPIFGGIAIIGYQALSYLRDGFWRSFSVIDGLEYFFDISWAKYPTDWIGLHTLLSPTPLSATLVLIGVLGIFSAFIISAMFEGV